MESNTTSNDNLCSLITAIPPLDIAPDTIIKVMGVGGGGCNAVNYMYSQGIKDVTFLVCNTDKQALGHSSVPAKLQLGPGLGAGGVPEKAREYAEASIDSIRAALDDGTKMLFLTAGMGGGTGTGASSVVADVAQQMDILTVGIVTLPFAFEGPKKIRKALVGVAQLAQKVDALLVINNEKLCKIYPELNMLNAFAKSDDVVANAARAVAEIITVPGYINTDFADVYNTLKNGNVAIMSVGIADGENRITKAIHEALHSPLMNSDVHGAKRVLLQIYCSRDHAIVMSENEQIFNFIKEVGEEVEVQWGLSVDDTLGEKVRVTIIATGYDTSDIPGLDNAVGEGKKTVDEVMMKNYYQSEDNTPAEAPEAAPQPKAADNMTHAKGTGDDEIIIDWDDSTPPTTGTAPQPSENESRQQRSRGWLRHR